MVLASMNAISMLASGKKVHDRQPEKRLACFCEQPCSGKVRDQEKRYGCLQAFWEQLTWQTQKSPPVQTNNAKEHSSP